MNLITLDFETYYDKSYSLTRMTTEEYVNDANFEIIGVSIKRDNEPAVWYTDMAALDSIDFSEAAVLAHNTQFDGAILKWRLGKTPAFWFDTLAMARAGHGAQVRGGLAALSLYYDIGTKGKESITNIGMRQDQFTPEQLHSYGEYCINDVELTHKLFMKMRDEPWFTLEQSLTINSIVDMFVNPKLHVDLNKLQSIILEQENMKKQELEFLFRYGFNVDTATKMLRSDRDFAKMLEMQGAKPPKRSDNSFAFARTDTAFRTMAKEHENPVVRQLISARLTAQSSIKETRAKGLIKIACRNYKKLPIQLNFMGAFTGRFSGGGGVNLQNLPRAGGIRSALVAPEGGTVVVCDSSQIEVRMLAYIAGQKDLIESFRTGRDVYSEFASNAYQRPITKENETERYVGKQAVISLGYGTGYKKLQHTLAHGDSGPSVVLSDDQARHIVNVYRQHNTYIVDLWRKCEQALIDMAQKKESGHIISNLLPYSSEDFSIQFPNKVKIVYTELHKNRNEFLYQKNIRGGSVPAKLYGAKVVENIVQGLASIVIAEQLAKISTRFPVALTVHDEIVVVCYTEQKEDAEKFMSEVMSTPPIWAKDLPLACEVGSGPSYGEAK